MGRGPRYLLVHAHMNACTLNPERPLQKKGGLETPSEPESLALVRELSRLRSVPPPCLFPCPQHRSKSRATVLTSASSGNTSHSAFPNLAAKVRASSLAKNRFASSVYCRVSGFARRRSTSRDWPREGRVASSVVSPPPPPRTPVTGTFAREAGGTRPRAGAKGLATAAP